MKAKDFNTEQVDGEDGLIAQWEGMELETPAGDTIIRPYDHQAVRPMYIAEAVIDQPGDEFGSAQTEGLIVGKRTTTVPRKYVDPPIKTDYEPYVTPYDVTFNATKQTADENAPPMDVEFAVSALRGQRPYTMKLDADGDDNVDKEWTDIQGEGRTYTFTYEEGGNYTASLTVTDNADTTVKKTIDIEVPEEAGGMSTTTIAAIVVVIIVVVAAAGYTMRS